MHTEIHPLAAQSAGSTRSLQSLHFGSKRNGKKTYLQASLHADEIPGMLVLHYLREQLSALESEGHIEGEIVLVPVANPIGLAQEIQGSAFGRFDLSTGINFNRGYLHLTPRVLPELAQQLTADPQTNVGIIRRQCLKALQQQQAHSEAEHLKKILQTLAIDADIVLDLHCDNQAVMHLYTGTPLAEQSIPLAKYIGAEALLVCEQSGDDPFDESCSRHWWELAQHFDASFPIPNACLSVTIELRGEIDVAHEFAQADARAIVAFLQHAGHIAGTPPQLTDSPCIATPLEGVEPLKAAHSGIVVFTRELGEHIGAGETIGDLIDPLSGVSTPLCASVSGVLFARISRRYVRAGSAVAKIAGADAYRSGKLLSM